MCLQSSLQCVPPGVLHADGGGESIPAAPLQNERLLIAVRLGSGGARGHLAQQRALGRCIGVRGGEVDGQRRGGTGVHRHTHSDTLVTPPHPLRHAQSLHVCAQLLQLQGRYSEALRVYAQALQLLRGQSPAGELQASAVQLLQHYAELLLLTKQYALARDMAQVRAAGGECAGVRVGSGCRRALPRREWV